MPGARRKEARMRPENQGGKAMWVYQWIVSKSGKPCWVVGFYSPDGKWHVDSDHEDRNTAREQCHYLNGGEVNK